MKFKLAVLFLSLSIIVLISTLIYVLNINPNIDEAIEQDNGNDQSMDEEINNTDSIVYEKSGQFKFSYPKTWRKVSFGNGLTPIEYCPDEKCTFEIFSIIYKQLDVNETQDLQKILDESFGLFPLTKEEVMVNGNKSLYAVYDTVNLKDLTWTILSHKNQLIQIQFREKDNSRGEMKDYSKYTEDAKKMVESIEFL